MKDKRFTITREYCGHPKPRHVLRFCGDFLSSHSSRQAARAARLTASLRHSRAVADLYADGPQA